MAVNKAELEAAEKANQLVNESFSLLGSDCKVIPFKILSDGTDLKISVASDREVSVVVFHESAFSRLPNFSSVFFECRTFAENEVVNAIKQKKELVLRKNIQSDEFNMKASSAGRYVLYIEGKPGLRQADGRIKVSKITL